MTNKEIIEDIKGKRKLLEDKIGGLISQEVTEFRKATGVTPTSISVNYRLDEIYIEIEDELNPIAERDCVHVSILITI